MGLLGRIRGLCRITWGLAWPAELASVWWARARVLLEIPSDPVQPELGTTALQAENLVPGSQKGSIRRSRR